MPTVREEHSSGLQLRLLTAFRRELSMTCNGWNPRRAVGLDEGHHRLEPGADE